jgi:hypothetical protein
MSAVFTLQSEQTEQGLQTLMPGVIPVRDVDRLEWRMVQPLRATKAQKPCDVGLFDLNARNQLELF